MRKVHLRLWLVGGVCLIFGTQVGIGLGWAESVYSRAKTNTHYSGQSEQNVEEDESTAANALVLVEDSGTLSEGSFEAAANVITKYGMHQAYSTAKITNGKNEQVEALAYSYFEDDWIVRGPPGETWGTMTIGVTLYGNYEGDGNNLYYDLGCDGCNDVDTEGSVTHIDDFSGPSQLVKVTIEYDIDEWFTIDSTLETTTYVGNYEDGVSSEGHIDFGHTTVITSLTLPPGHTLETKSGTTYPLDYTPPGTNTSTPQTASSGGGGGGGCFISNLNK